ncbi:MAG: hypothetical protein M5U12_27565 [Verrucomicrobia bacterium]|nr:hypothetical protein [Verrucomicrobiota bacterium]
MLAFGDGYVEIQNTKEVGGLAVAVASDEAHNGSGQMDEWKRQRLLGVGADVVIPDFRDGKVLLDLALGTGTKHTRCRPDIDRHTSSMNPPPEPLDLTRLRVFPLAERKSLSTLEEILVEPADDPAPVARAGPRSGEGLRRAHPIRPGARCRGDAHLWRPPGEERRATSAGAVAGPRLGDPPRHQRSRNDP